MFISYSLIYLSSFLLFPPYFCLPFGGGGGVGDISEVGGVTVLAFAVIQFLLLLLVLYISLFSVWFWEFGLWFSFLFIGLLLVVVCFVADAVVLHCLLFL